MAVTVQRQFEAAVTEMDQDACVGSAIENGAKMITFDLRKLDLQRALGTTSTVCWRKAPYHVDIPDLSTFHNPIKYRFMVAPGAYLNTEHQRVSFTPDIQGVSTAQPMRHSVIRLACDLAVMCGVSLRPIALLLSVLFLIPMRKSSMKRWLDDIGGHLPTPEERLRQLLALAPATECHIDGYSPRGTEHCVMVVKDEHDRLLITHEAASANGEDARPCLQRGKDRGRQVTAAFSDDSHSCTAAIQAVCPHARLQADHCHTVKHSWGHLKKSLLSYRRKVKASGADKNDEQLMAVATKLWTLRWSLLKKPGTLSVEERQAIAELASEDEGLMHHCRRVIRQRVHIFAHAHSEAQATRRLQQLHQDIHVMADQHVAKMPQCLDDHWEQALRYLRKKGIGKHRRGSNAESGMRLLRRLEKNHDGSRSATTRQHYMQIY